MLTVLFEHNKYKAGMINPVYIIKTTDVCVCLCVCVCASKVSRVYPVGIFIISSTVHVMAKPHRGVRGNGTGPPKSVGFIIWGPLGDP